MPRATVSGNPSHLLKYSILNITAVSEMEALENLLTLRILGVNRVFVPKSGHLTTNPEEHLV